MYRHYNYDNLIHKIFNFLPSKNKACIKNIINRKCDEPIKLLTISKLITQFVSNANIRVNPHRQDFIINKIKKYLDSSNRVSNTLIYDDCVYIDIGGGNGNVLSGIEYLIRQTNTTKKENFICLETQTDWNEEYKFDNTNITYVLNNEFNLEANSASVILCMVSLHHMTDTTITHILQQLYRVLKPGGKLLIKEHDNTSLETENYILWEHHLYHILDCAYQGKTIDVSTYYDKNIYNFKGKTQWTEIITSHGFNLVQVTDRFLSGEFIRDKKNSTELYWAIYDKL